MPAFVLFAAVVAGNMQPLHRAEPIESPGSWLSTEDYPADALRRGVEGTVGFRLTVDESGRPADCAIGDSSGDTALDEATCSLVLARARFRPARDAYGKAVPDSFTSRIRWALDANPFLIGEAPVRIVNIHRIDASGTISCTTTFDGRPVPNIASPDCDAESMRRNYGAFAEHLRGRPAQFSNVIIFAPVGADAPIDDGADLGQRYSHSVMRLSVAPDGRVTECRVVQNVFESGFVVPPDKQGCEYYRAAGPAIFRVTTSQSVRFVQITNDEYFRINTE